LKILSIVGARPQFIKLGPLSREIRKHFSEVIIHTGQHFDNEMSDLFFKELNIARPNYNLQIHGGNHGEQTGRMLIEIETVILEESPDVIIIFGDTNTTLAGALIGAKLNIMTVHVEAGLRSKNKSMPEEINRIAADHASDCLFAPTQTAMENLRFEGLAHKAFLTGDIMVDALQQATKKVQNQNIANRWSLQANEYYLCTLHRPYNVDNSKTLGNILRQLGTLDRKILFPVHPRTRNIIKENKLETPANIILAKPIGYLDFINLQMNAEKIITDSGGIQKEAYILKKPCITLRSETEWIETVAAGWNLLLNPAEDESIAAKIASFVPAKNYSSLFGDNVAEKMVQTLIEQIS